MKIKDLHVCERPRERMANYGSDKLSNAELLAILLGTGSGKMNAIELANKILKQKPELDKVDIKELSAIKGIGPAKASIIMAALELGRRFFANKKSALFLSPEDVWRELADLRNNKKEHFVVFYLDIRNQEIKRDIVSIGTLSMSLVHPREVFEPAIRNLAAQIMLAHNHPSGIADPSEEDINVTKRLIEAGKLLGIEVLDHVIVAKSGWASLREKGFVV